VTRPGHRLESLAERLPSLAGRMRPAGSTPQPGAKTLIYFVDAPTPDVSSTELRERLRRGDRITGLVPPLVEAHIRQHGLYQADQLHGQD
jgi:nicotinic acid mononucleotide adenylyltransferase